jgi:hypothetical protein
MRDVSEDSQHFTTRTIVLLHEQFLQPDFFPSEAESKAASLFRQKFLEDPPMILLNETTKEDTC